MVKGWGSGRLGVRVATIQDVVAQGQRDAVISVLIYANVGDFFLFART